MLENRNDKDNAQNTNTTGAFRSDGRDVEFSKELADQDDVVAQVRSKAADQRAKARKNNKQ